MSLFDIQAAVHLWLQATKQVVIATVVETWGSSPRRTGAKMAINNALEMVGSVSGGCVEADVADNALDLMQSPSHMRLLRYHVTNDEALSVGLACGGSITVLLEKLHADVWHALHTHGQQRLTMVTAIDEQNAPRKLILATNGDILMQSGDFGTQAIAALQHEAQAALASRQSVRKTVAGIDAFFDVHLPPPRVILVGGAHVGVILHQLAHTLGFDVILIDPRRAFATSERFPQAKAIHHKYPNVVLPQIPLDADSYVVVVSHDPKIDDPALAVALRSEARYIGVMSSRRTHEERIARLKERGLQDEQLARIHVPIGLNLNAQNPEEIALSIMAQIVSVKNQA